MANQKIPTTDTVEDYTPEKIILSGSPFVSAILGPGAYRITPNAAPISITPPVVTGYPVAPTTFYCSEGTFSSSPRATLTYQWFYNDLLMGDETENLIDLDDSGITRIVTGQNVLNTYPTIDGTTSSHMIASVVAMPTDAVTVEFWVKTSQDGDNIGGTFSYAVAADNNEFTFFGVQDLQMIINGSNEVTGFPINSGEWTHVAVTWRGSDGETILYLNGYNVWSATMASGTSLTSNGSVAIGQEQDTVGGSFDPNQCLDGEICEVRIWSVVRTEEEIASNRHDVLVGNETNLTSYWPMGEGEGSVASDLTSAANDGVYSNVSWNPEDGPVFTEREDITILGRDDPFHCVVTYTNSSGSDSAQSNDKSLEDVEPGYTMELDMNFITGIITDTRFDLTNADIHITTGINLLDAGTLTGCEVYMSTGVTGLANIDCTELEIDMMTGMPNTLNSEITEMDSYMVPGFAGSSNETSMVAEGHAISIPVFVADLIVLNGDAENSDMGDWTMDDGSVTSVTTAPMGHPADLTAYREGLRFFKAADRGRGVSSQMSQALPIDAGDYTLVDTGRCVAVVTLIHQSEEGIDHLEVTMEALDAGLSVLDTETTIVPLNPEGINNRPPKGWQVERNINELLTLPTLTRHVNLVVLFQPHATQGSIANTVYADGFKVELLEIE